MQIELHKVSFEEKPILRNLLELYQHDHSEFDGADINQHGLYDYKYLDHYWTEPGRHAFFIRADGKLAGFIMVRTAENTGDGVHHIAEFFILRKFRRQGIGKRAVHMIFAIFPGKWRIFQVPRNLPGQAFWRNAITTYTDGHFTESYCNEEPYAGPIQEFESPGSEDDANSI